MRLTINPQPLRSGSNAVGNIETPAVITYLDLVFVPSYSSRMPNWHEVMTGRADNLGRLARAQAVAKELGLSVIANDAVDRKNHALYEKPHITNLNTAHNTDEEVRYALDHSQNRAVLFVTSPDHLPRVVRDVLAQGGAKCAFIASDVPFSSSGARSVIIREPEHMK